MSIWNIKDIRLALESEIVTDNIAEDIDIDLVEIDSRRVGENTLFICIKGDNNDGHNFIKKAFDNGAKIILASYIPEEFLEDKRIILVKDGFNALNKLAIFARSRTNAKVIAVTGSVGKTTVKDMCYTILSQISNCYATSGNFNNHFGVPITLANLRQDVDFAILEAGMNHMGEIEYLSKMINPDIAIITTVTSAHIGNFNNETEIAKAKSEIFSGLKKGGFAIINRDNQYFDFIKNEAMQYDISEDNIISFGFSETSDVRITSIENVENQLSSKISILFNKERENISYEINSIHQGVIFNSLIVFTCLKILNIDLNNVIKLFSDIQLRDGRGNILKIEKDNYHYTIIDDSYNANPTSTIAAIDYLNDIKRSNSNNNVTIILGDMFELGEREIAEHIKIGENLANSNIDKILLVGNLMKNINKNNLKNQIFYFKDSDQAAENINNIIDNGDIILVKGSRGMKMEKIIDKIKYRN
jgi:UDP-N-acetylmuramoyl-tripeptide--D-alanyl-D-alanine ligase